MKRFWKTGVRTFLVLAVMLLLMVPAVSALEVTATASRDIASQSISPGKSTEVTVTFTSLLEEARAFALKENVPEGWTLIRGEDDAFRFKAITNEWVWIMEKEVEPGETKTVTYTLSVPAGATPGDYTVSGTVTAASVANEVGGNTTIQVTAPEFDPMDYDADGDGEISKAEATTAVVDYFNGEITKEQALEVITFYFAS